MRGCIVNHVLGRKPQSADSGGQEGKGSGSDPWPPCPIRLNLQVAACTGKAPPRPYFPIALPHLIDGLGKAATLL